ncbi:hypothetical protein ACTFIZ_007946 [Dictyostelium cf. discoideum]
MKYIKEFDYELRHISGKKNGFADLLSPNQFSMAIRDEEINDICYLSEDGFKKLMKSATLYHDTKYRGHHALDITYNNIRQDYYFKVLYLVKFKCYPESEWIKELVREYWNKVQKEQLNSRRGRENATPEAIEPIVPSPLSQEVQNSQISQPTTPTNQNLNNINQKTKSRNQNTCSDDEFDLGLIITTTSSGRKVTPKRP